MSSDVWIGQARFRTLHDAEDFDLVESVQPGGEQTPLHRHVYVEHLFVVEGTIDAWAGDEHRLLEPGETLTVPAGTAHALRMGPEGARGVLSSRPGRFAKFIAAVGTDHPGAVDPEAMARAAARFGDELLGPPGVLPDRG